MNLLAFKTYLVGIFVAAGYGKQYCRYKVVDTVSFEGLKEADLRYLRKKYQFVFITQTVVCMGRFNQIYYLVLFKGPLDIPVHKNIQEIVILRTSKQIKNITIASIRKL